MLDEPFDDSDGSCNETSDSGSDEETKPASSKRSTNADGIKRIITASKLKEKISTKNKKCKDDKKKLKVYKKSNKSSWNDIFAQSKAVVSVTFLKPEGNIMNINFCDSTFLTTFGYTDCKKGLCFNDLMGKASSQDTLKKLEMSFQSGITATLYINLYRSDKSTPLSCHISVLPFKCNTNNAVSAEGPSRSLTNELTNTSGFRTVWGVITIRSASVVGNARVSGIGILGMHRVTETVRVNYHDKVFSSAEVAKVSSRSKNIENYNAHSIHNDETLV